MSIDREFGSRASYFNLPYFSDLERFAVRTGERRSERVFLFCGSLIARKGVDLLAVRSFSSHVSFPACGSGSLEKGSCVKVSHKRLRPVSERVEFTGFKDWDELPELYASADVLCVPSRYDGWGLVVPEGLGVRVAGDRDRSDGSGARVYSETGSNGWLIPAGDESAILRSDA